MRINECILPRPLSLYNPKSVAATVTMTRLRTNITEEELSRKEEFWVKFNTDPSKDAKWGKLFNSFCYSHLHHCVH